MLALRSFELSLADGWKSFVALVIFVTLVISGIVPGPWKKYDN
jgi:hypothetical protein